MRWPGQTPTHGTEGHRARGADVQDIPRQPGHEWADRAADGIENAADGRVLRRRLLGMVARPGTAVRSSRRTSLRLGRDDVSARLEQLTAPGRATVSTNAEVIGRMPWGIRWSAHGRRAATGSAKGSIVNARGDAGLLILRVGVGGVLIAHGGQKLFGWFEGHGIEGTAAAFEQMGFRPSRASAMGAGLGEAGGGALIGLGLATPAAAAAAAGTMIAATSVHGQRGSSPPAAGTSTPPC